MQLRVELSPLAIDMVEIGLAKQSYRSTTRVSSFLVSASHHSQT